MTAAELYQTDADFRALIQCWIDNRRCPLPMADYLRERDLEGQAEAAEWAACRQDEIDEKFPEDFQCGPFPRYSDSECWWLCCDSKAFHARNYIPLALCPDEHQHPPIKRQWFRQGFYGKTQRTVPTALLWLLDRWAEVLAEGGELPKVVGGLVTN